MEIDGLESGSSGSQAVTQTNGQDLLHGIPSPKPDIFHGSLPIYTKPLSRSLPQVFKHRRLEVFAPHLGTTQDSRYLNLQLQHLSTNHCCLHCRLPASIISHSNITDILHITDSSCHNPTCSCYTTATHFPFLAGCSHQPPVCHVRLHQLLFLHASTACGWQPKGARAGFPSASRCGKGVGSRHLNGSDGVYLVTQDLAPIHVPVCVCTSCATAKPASPTTPSHVHNLYHVAKTCSGPTENDSETGELPTLWTAFHARRAWQ